VIVFFENAGKDAETDRQQGEEKAQKLFHAEPPRGAIILGMA
jgi:hypothetical protein